MGEVNQFKWVGVRPTEPVETIFTFTGKLQQKRNDIWNYSLGAGNSYTWLSVSGSGLIQAIGHRTDGISPSGARQYLYIDGVNIERDIYVDVFIMNESSLYNSTHGSMGRCGFRRITWDTTNNVYFVHSYLSETYFTESFSLEFHNSSGSTGTFGAWCTYQVLATTKVLRLISKIKEMREKEVNELRKMINKDFGKCYVVIWCMQSKVIDEKRKKYVNISKLEFLLDDATFEKNKDKIINRLAKEKMICL